MSCTGCLPVNVQIEYEKVKSAAKKYAIENEKTVAIYREGESWQFIIAEQSAGLNIREYVSK